MGKAGSSPAAGGVEIERGAEAVRERVQGPHSREVQATDAAASSPVEKASPPQAISQSTAAKEVARQLEQFRAAGRQGKKQRELKIELARPKPVIEPQQQERERAVKQEKEGHGHGLGL